MVHEHTECRAATLRDMLTMFVACTRARDNGSLLTAGLQLIAGEIWLMGGIDQLL